MNTSAGDDVTQEGKLSNTSMLDLNVTETVETILVGVVKEPKRIEESKRRLNTELVLEGVEGGGGLASLGRREGGGGGNGGGKDDRLHVDYYCTEKSYGTRGELAKDLTATSSGLMNTERYVSVFYPTLPLCLIVINRADHLHTPQFFCV